MAMKILFPKEMFLVIFFKSISFFSIIKLTLEFFAINFANEVYAVSYTHLRAHETDTDLV